MSDASMWPEKQTVVLLFGGRSSEHGVSCVTAASVLQHLDRSRYEVILVGITPNGASVHLREDEVVGFSLSAGGLPEVRENGTRVLWPASADTHTLSVVNAQGELRSLGRVHVVLPMMHGPFGEDGTVQGMLELVDLPYIGSGVLASALCMDKHTVKALLAASGIPVAPWNMITRSQYDRDPSRVAALDSGLNYPLFVKPNRAGSSIGVSRVTEAAGLAAAVDIAFAEDSMVLVEEGIVGREIEIAVLEGRDGAAPRASAVVGEIAFTGRAFYDFEAKYLGGSGVELILPASVTDAEYVAIRTAAVTAFEVAQCSGLARVDFFLTAEGPVLNEINTLPGFTPISMYPQLWERSGLNYTALITELIELALA